jgi:peptidoglycan hydrolase CwlO-like protein
MNLFLISYKSRCGIFSSARQPTKSFINILYTMSDPKFVILSREESLVWIERTVTSILKKELAPIEKDLKSMNEDLKSMNEDITSMNEGLKSVHEDLKSVHEDAKAFVEKLTSFISSNPRPPQTVRQPGSS